MTHLLVGRKSIRGRSRLQRPRRGPGDAERDGTEGIRPTGGPLLRPRRHRTNARPRSSRSGTAP